MWDLSVVACKLLVAVCGVQFSDQGSNPGTPHWKRGVLAIGPPVKSQHTFTLILEILPEQIGEREVILNEVDFMIPFTLTGEALI